MTPRDESKTRGGIHRPQAGSDGALPRPEQTPAKDALSSLVENLPGMAYRCSCDEQKMVRFLTQSCSRLTGYLPEKFLGKSIQVYRDIVHPDDRKRVAQEIDESGESNRSFAVDYRIRTANGSERHVFEQGKFILEDDGGALVLQGYVQDIIEPWESRITDQSHELRQARDRLGHFGRILDHSLNEIYIFDAHTLKFVDANRGARKNLGYTIEELRVLTPVDIKPLLEQHDFDRILEPLQMKQSEKIQFSTVHQRKDGSQYPVEVGLQFASIGPTEVYVAIISDLTESKRSELELRRLNRALLVHTECNKTLAHADNDIEFLNELCRIIVEVGGFNSVWAGLCGDGKEETISPVAQFGFESNYLDSLVTSLAGSGTGVGPAKRAIRSGIFQVIQDIPTETDQGKWKDEAARRGFMASIALPIMGNDQVPVGVLKIYSRTPFAFGRKEVELLEDLATDAALGIKMICARKERKQLEAQLQQSQKLETIGTLASGIAHDFNNVLQAILGYSELALIDIPEERKSYNYVNQVISASKRAKDLVRQILTFSQQIEPERQIMDVGLAVVEAVRLLRATLPSNIEIGCDVLTEDRLVLADAGQIHQVLMNLGTNALHAMKEKGGVLTIELDSIYVDENGGTKSPYLVEGPYVRLRVRDTGVGMDDQIIEQIFNPFFTTKEIGEGTGLGLSVVHGIMTSHSGSITVTSELESGTTFELLLPIAANVTEEGHEKEEIELRGNEHILCVDDEEMIATMIKSALGNLGYQVTICSSSLTACDLIRANPDGFDLLIIDQMMPHMLGLELVSSLRRLGIEVPAILFSGFGSEIAEKKAMDAGVEIVLAKPVNLDDLARAIRQALND